MKLNPILGTFLCLLELSCQNEKVAWDESSSPTTDSSMISSSAAVNISNDSLKFVRTADVKFLVTDVEKSTYYIENVIHRHGGYISNTSLSSNLENKETVQITKDSTLETTHYSVSNMITIRVPNHLLDSTLKEIADEVKFLDHRTIKAEDVSIQFLENQIGQKRYLNKGARYPEKLRQKDTDLTRELNIYHREKADEYFIANKYLDRDVNLSVVNLEIYQRSSIRKEMIANPEIIQPYQAGLFSRMGDAVRSGGNILVDIFMAVIRMWGILLLLVVGYFLLRKNKAALAGVKK